MMRFRRAVPFQGLAIMFGVGSTTAHRYYEELLGHFHKEIVPLLFHPLTGQQIDQMTPEDALRTLPGARFIVDATGFKLKSAENCLLSRLLYSAYHHASEGFVVFGKGWRAGACPNLILLVCTINGLWIFRSRIFGGLSAEVLTIWNNSLMPKMVDSKVFAAGKTF